MAKWKFYKYLIFSALVQRIRHTTRSISYTGITIIFVESKHVLPKEILENSDFAGPISAIATNRKEEAYAIISNLYKSNTQICQKGQLSSYYKIDFTVLWFMNTFGC